MNKPAREEASLELVIRWLDDLPAGGIRRGLSTPGANYVMLHQKLVKMFDVRSCLDPEECADETFDRLAEALKNDREIRTDNKIAYIHGIARHVLSEWYRKQQLKAPLDDQLIATEEDLDEETKAASISRMERCLESLGQTEMNLICRYEFVGAGTRPRQRRRLAKANRCSENALRIKICRIRTKLRNCLEDS